MESIDRQNCRVFLAAFIEHNKLKIRQVAKAITCSETTFNRIIAGKTSPSDEMLRQSGIMFELGYDSYSKLSKAKKEKISEMIGSASGGVLGFSAITAAVSSLGIAGLSAAGITTGLGALGAIVGGGMVAGISVAATIPIAAGTLGYAIIKAVKVVCENYQTDQEKYDPFWEMPLEIEPEE